MKCTIQYFRPLRNKLEIITLKEGKIYLDDGRYEKLISEDEDVVNEYNSRLFELFFTWKQEYIGERVYDGEKYLIEVEVNHKKKKYKIQNKFPENWEEFLEIKESIIALNKD